MQKRSRQMPVEALASATLARMTETKNGNNERKSEAKRRQTQGRVLPRLAGAAAAPEGAARLSAFHRGSRPKESFICKGLSTRPGFLRRGGDTFCASL